MKKCCYDLNQYDITPTSPSTLRYILHPSVLPADIQSLKVYNAATMPLTNLITDPPIIPASSDPYAARTAHCRPTRPLV